MNSRRGVTHRKYGSPRARVAERVLVTPITGAVAHTTVVEHRRAVAGTF